MEVENRKHTIAPVQSPVHKKPRADGDGQSYSDSDSYSWEGKSSKVCIPLFCFGHTIDDRECNVCVVDFSANSEDETNDFSRSLPTFKIKYDADGEREVVDVMDGLCALGNRLYIFESCCLKEKKAIYCIDISNPHELASRTMLISHLPKVGEMLSAKYNPAALVVPNTSNILAFPTLLFTKGMMSNILGGFELFDTVDGSSHKLPSIQLKAPIRGCHIEAYGFIDTHRLSVQIRGGLIFVLDLDLVDKGWVPTINPSWLDRFAANSRTNSTSFALVESRFCFQTCRGFRDLQDGKEEKYRPSFLWQLPKVEIDMNATQSFLTLLNHDEQAGESCICRLTMDICEHHLPRKSESIRMQFDVAVFYLKRYKQELELSGNSILDYARFVKSLRYSFNLPGPEYVVFTNSTFFSF